MNIRTSSRADILLRIEDGGGILIPSIERGDFVCFVKFKNQKSKKQILHTHQNKNRNLNKSKAYWW